MPSACTTFGAHQIIELAFLEEVRTLNPDRTSLYMGSSTENLLEIALDTVALHIEFETADSTLALIVGTAYHRTVVHDVSLSVVIEEEARVDAVNLLQIDRFAPTLGWVLGLDEEVSGSHVGGNHIEGLVLLVVADGWCEDAG